jgi:NADH-quinone oxidoreductase subunit A
VEYFSFFLYVGIILAVAVGALVLSSLLGRKRRSVVKDDPYECGVPQLGETRTEFNVRFFIIAMLFVLFDIEAVLLAPYAIRYVDLGAEGLAEVGVFVIVLGFGLLYAWRKGALDWSTPLGVKPQDWKRIQREFMHADKPEEAAHEDAAHAGHGSH